MTPEAKSALDRAVIDTLGSLAYMDAVPVDPDLDDREAACVRIDLLSPAKGSLSMWIALPDADALTQAAWGAIPGDPIQQRREFLCELANVVAGNFLARQHPGEQVSVGFPNVIERANNGRGALASYDVEGCRLNLELTA